MSEKRDYRVQRTYDSLIESFKALLAEKPFDAITVKELCAAARIRPATFYTHFKDKYDFFAFLVREIRDSRFAASAQAAADQPPAAQMARLIAAVFDFADENEAFLKALDADSMLMAMVHTAVDSVETPIRKILDEAEAAGAALPADPELCTQFFIGALSQSVRWWLAHKKSVGKEEMIAKVAGAAEWFAGKA